jgi:cytochrome P450
MTEDVTEDVDSEAPGSPMVLDSESSRHPQPMYKLMRDLDPIFRVQPAGVIVTKHVDIEQIFKQPDVFSSAMSAADLGNIRPLIPLQIDLPEHRMYRKILQPLFSPQRMNALHDPVTALVNELIDRFIDDDEIDFSAQFSVPFPSQVFLTMLGLPMEELPRFLAMKDGIIRPQDVVGKPTGDPAVTAHQRATATSIYDYFNEILDERRRQPKDDLLSQFLAAEVEGDRLSHDAIVDICFLFLIAGLDTVSASLDCFFRYLAEEPDQRRRLVASPEMVPRAVEELLRWETPVIAVPRIAAQDTELSGCPISKGEHVMVLIASGNTDETELPDSDQVQLDREVNRHLAFGGGIHRCLGSHLARLELRVALREWHARIPDYAIPPGTDLLFTTGVRSTTSFPMQLRQSA